MNAFNSQKRETRNEKRETQNHPSLQPRVKLWLSEKASDFARQSWLRPTMSDGKARNEKLFTFAFNL